MSTLTAKEWHTCVSKVDSVLNVISGLPEFSRLSIVGNNFRTELNKCFERAAAKELQEQWNS